LTVASNLEVIKGKVKQASIRANRSLDDIQVIAVTKTVEIDLMKEAISEGLVNLGENRVQELTRKYEILNDNNIKWHLIGHLQKNKVKYIVDKVELIHSLDSYDLALEIERRAGDIGRTIHCLVQVNVSGEETKYGIEPNEVATFINKLEDLKYVQVDGLMTIAPYTEDNEETRVYFKRLKNIFDDISTLNLKNSSMKYLSMGMSNDFEVAIEEGANLVRIGSAIFGERVY